VRKLIKLKDELVNFPVIDLKQLSKNNDFPENIKNAVQLYNKAVERVKFNSSDIAMIELKKAIKIFPEFYDAILLLSLCYYANDEKTRAIAVLNSIRDEAEKNKCFRYLDSVVGKSVSGNRMVRRPEPVPQKQQRPAHTVSPVGPSYQQSRQMHRNDRRSAPRSQQQQKSFSYYTKYGLKKLFTSPMFFRGVVVTGALLIVVGLIFGIYTLYNVNKQADSEKQKIADLEARANEAVTQAKAYEDTLKALLAKNEEYVREFTVPELVAEYSKKNNGEELDYEKLVKKIYLIDTTGLDTENKSKIESIQNEVLPVYADKTHNLAKNNIIESKFNEAIKQLSDICKYYPNYPKIAEVKLDLAKAYRDSGNNEQAIIILKEIVELHSQSVQVVEARNILTELGAG